MLFQNHHGSSRLVSASALAAALVLALAAQTINAGVGVPQLMNSGLNNPIMWQINSSSVLITQDIVGGRSCFFQDAIYGYTSPMTQRGPIPGTWIPYGSYQKWLMYVNDTQSLYRVMNHDVDISVPEQITIPTQTNQTGCGMIGNRLVYGQYRDSAVNGVVPVDLKHYDLITAYITPLVTSDTEKTQFAHDGTTIVYRASNNSTAGIYGVLFTGGPEFQITDHNGYYPSIMGTLTAWAEVNGTGFNIMGKDLVSGQTRLIATTNANPPRPTVGRDTIFWEDTRNQTTTGLDIYGYNWPSSTEFAVTTATGDQTKVLAGDLVVVWASGPTSNQTLYYSKIQDPLRIADLRASVIGASSAELSWTSAGVSGTSPVLYELRMRIDGLVTEATWPTAMPIAGLPTPQSPLVRETFTVNSLQSGLVYFGMKVKYQDQQWSPLSNAITVNVPSSSTSISAPDGTYVSLIGAVTGIGADGSVFVMHANRIVGVKCAPRTDQGTPTVGQRVTATGKIGPDPLFYGPLLTDATIRSLSVQDTIKVWKMSNRFVGGYSARYGGTAQQYLANVWLPVRTTGKISGFVRVGAVWEFYIKDGSSLPDNGGKGIKVITRFSPPLGIGNGVYAVVEGISQVSKTNGRLIEVVADNKVVTP